MSTASQQPEQKSLPTTVVTPKVRNTSKSSALHEEAVRLIPGGASSSIRWASYEPYPLFMKSGAGSKIVDADDNSYIDYLLAFGALINGHSHPRITEAVQKQAQEGMMFGTTIELEVDMAKKFRQFVPSADMVVFANGGMDATSNALRIARAATGKDLILKFEGHYHGQHDYAMVSVEAPPVVAGMEEYPRSLPYSAGIPSLVLDTVVVAPWNNAKALERIMKRHRNDIAAIIMEPVMANSTVIPPNVDYLKSVKEIAASNDALLIFDEVITGFRVAPGGAQQLYGVTADLATWGKALGGGLPLAAVSGKKEYMELIAPGRCPTGDIFRKLADPRRGHGEPRSSGRAGLPGAEVTQGPHGPAYDRAFRGRAKGKAEGLHTERAWNLLIGLYEVLEDNELPREPSDRLGEVPDAAPTPIGSGHLPAPGQLRKGRAFHGPHR